MRYLTCQSHCINACLRVRVLPGKETRITLQAEMIRAMQSWQNLITEDSQDHGKWICTVPSLEYPDAVIRDTINVDAQQNEADTAMEQMRNVLGVDVLG